MNGGVVTGTLLVNTMVVADGAGTVLTRTAETVIWTGPWPDLTPSHKLASPTVLPGGTISYTLVVSNAGQFTSSVLLTDIMPPGVAVVTAMPALGPSFGVAPSGMCTWISVLSKISSLMPSRRARLRTTDADKAEKELTEIVRDDPACAEAYVLLASLRRKNGQEAEARDLLRRAERWGEAEASDYAGALGLGLLLAR